MATYTQTVEGLPDHVIGDVWPPDVQPGAQVTFTIRRNAANPTVALERVVGTFKLGSETFKLDSESDNNPDAPITIQAGSTWVAVIDQIETFLPTAGKWEFDVKFYGVGMASPLTALRGEITVHPKHG